MSHTRPTFKQKTTRRNLPPRNGGTRCRPEAPNWSAWVRLEYNQGDVENQHIQGGPTRVSMEVIVTIVIKLVYFT